MTTQVPDSGWQARFFTLLLSSISILTPFGLGLAGPVAEALGIDIVYVITGIGCLVVAAIWALNPTILYLEDQPRKSETAL